jgi:hypothetical protein
MLKIKAIILVGLLLSVSWSFEELQDSVSIAKLTAKADSLANEITALKRDTLGVQQGIVSNLRWGSGWFVSSHVMKDVAVGYTRVSKKNRRLSLALGATTASYDTLQYKNGYKFYQTVRAPAAMLRLGYGTPIFRNFISMDFSMDNMLIINPYAKDGRLLVGKGISLGMDIAFWFSPTTSLLLGGESGISMYDETMMMNPNGWANGQVRVGLQHYFAKPVTRRSAGGN